jgi:hypothetical protein
MTFFFAYGCKCATTAGSVGVMARGETPNRNSGEPGESGRGRPGARQREVLAQFEQAIAGMDTRQIQLGLRHLLASGMRGADVAGSVRETEVAEAARVAEVARRAGEADAACRVGETGRRTGETNRRTGEADAAPGETGAQVARGAGEAGLTRGAGEAEVVRGAGGTDVAREAGGVAGVGEATAASGAGVAEWGPDEGGHEEPVVAFGAMTSVRTDAGSPHAGSPRSDSPQSGSPYAGRPWIDPDAMPGPVAQLLSSVRTPSARRQLERLISEARLDRTDTVGIATMARMVWPYSWLLDRVGDDGIKLTDAGHLPPAEVTTVIEDLNLAAEGVGQVSRENQAQPVVQLRESAQATGLVRKNRGRLELTARGAELRRDPAALWWHLAGQLPLRSAAISEVPPGMILLTCVAARFTDGLDLTVARMLTAIGWLNSDGSPLTGAEASAASYGTYSVLRRLGALPSTSRDRQAPYPPSEGVAFARAALSTWPGVAPA